MAAKKSTRDGDRVSGELHSVEGKLDDTLCALTCALATLDTAEDEGGIADGDACRALWVMRRALSELEDARDVLGGALARIGPARAAAA